jgi:hypothetical protein
MPAYCLLDVRLEYQGRSIGGGRDTSSPTAVSITINKPHKGQ